MDKTTMRRLMVGALAAVLAAPSLTWAQPGGPGRGGPGPEHEEGFDDELPPKEREALLKELREHNPGGFKHLQKMRKAQPRKFRRRMRRMRPMLKNPKARKMMLKKWKGEWELRLLAETFKKTEDEGEKDKLKGKIRSVLNEQFDAKLKDHETHLARMEKRIAKMKERIAKRRKLKKKIVEQKLGQMTGGDESWDW